MYQKAFVKSNKEYTRIKAKEYKVKYSMITFDLLINIFNLRKAKHINENKIKTILSYMRNYRAINLKI